MNRVNLIGRFTHDIELKKQNNITIINSTIATNRPFKNKEGEYEADFINITAFNKTAELISKYCSKGTKVGIEGSIRTNKATLSDGTNKYYMSVLVERIEFLESKNKVEENSLENAIETMQNTVDPFEDFATEVSLNDENLPF